MKRDATETYLQTGDAGDFGDVSGVEVREELEAHICTSGR